MRRRAAEKREVIPEPKYGSILVTRFISQIMKSGKKSLAERIVYTALTALLERVKKQPELLDDQKENKENNEEGGDNASGKLSANEIVVRAFEKAIANVKPSIEVKSRRVGGATYQIPMPVTEARQVTLAIRWIINAARNRAEKGIANRLAGELFDALLKRGEANKKREDTYRMAKANQAFAHYSWR